MSIIELELPQCALWEALAVMCLVWIGRLRRSDFDWDAREEDWAWTDNVEVLYEFDDGGCTVMSGLRKALGEGRFPGRDMTWLGCLVHDVPRSELGVFVGHRTVMPAWHRLREDHPGLPDAEILERLSLVSPGRIDSLPEGHYAVAALDMT